MIHVCYLPFEMFFSASFLNLWDALLTRSAMDWAQRLYLGFVLSLALNINWLLWVCKRYEFRLLCWISINYVSVPFPIFLDFTHSKYLDETCMAHPVSLENNLDVQPLQLKIQPLNATIFLLRITSEVQVVVLFPMHFVAGVGQRRGGAGAPFGGRRGRSDRCGVPFAANAASFGRFLGRHPYFVTPQLMHSLVPFALVMWLWLNNKPRLACP